MTHVLGKNINCFQHIAEELHFMKKCTEIALLLEFLFVDILGWVLCYHAIYRFCWFNIFYVEIIDKKKWYRDDQFDMDMRDTHNDYMNLVNLFIKTPWDYLFNLILCIKL